MYTVRLENLGASKIVFEGTKREAVEMMANIKKNEHDYYEDYVKLFQNDECVFKMKLGW